MRVIFSFLFLFSSFAAIDKQSFNSIPIKVLESMSSEIESSGLEISFNLNWESETKNAGASRKANKGLISLYGGYARLSSMTKDTFAHTICHELGHLIGGAPQVMPTSKYSSEAQSDYFATKTCLPKYLKNKQRQLNSLPTLHRELCLNNFTKISEQRKCAYLMGVAIDKLIVDNELQPRQKWESPELLDNSILGRTEFNDYPKVSCRYTTYIFGVIGSERPACWFDKRTDLATRTYIENYNYAESMFIGEAYDVTATILGCKFRLKSIDFFREGILGSIYEDDLIDSEITTFTSCKFSNGDTVSGTATEYLGDYFYNLNSTDK
jgi:hypothetical protein